MPKVSVIVPAYNAEAHIEECVASILAQTLPDIEIILIDDGSTDATGALLARMARGRRNVILRSQPNQGLYRTRRIGLSMARGDYVGWVDADDFIEPDCFETLYRAALTNDSELAYCDYDWHPHKVRTKEKWFREYRGKRDVAYLERNSQLWNKLAKRSLLERLNIGSMFERCYDESYIKVLLAARNPVSVRRVLYHYRVDATSMSTAYGNVAHYEGFIRASEALREAMAAHCADDYLRDYFDYRVIYYTLITMLVAANAGDRPSYERCRRQLTAEMPTYAKNAHFSGILNANFGPAKAAVLGRVIPNSYALARLAARAALR